MSMAQVIVLAIVQGLTEFLPVSSTAHLYLSSWLLGWAPQALEFDTALHTGTLLAILIYFLPDWKEMLLHNLRLLGLLAVGSIPVGIAGLVFSRKAEDRWRNAYVMGVMLVLIGIVIWLADRSAGQHRDLRSVNLGDSIGIGLSQIMAIVPGTSRSGITITAGLFLDFTREAAARFSFLLSAPAVAAAAGKALYHLHEKKGLRRALKLKFVVGAALSASTGYAAIGWILHYLRQGSLRPFVYYRLIFGIIVLALASIRRPAG